MPFDKVAQQPLQPKGQFPGVASLGPKSTQFGTLAPVSVPPLKRLWEAVKGAVQDLRQTSGPRLEPSRAPMPSQHAAWPLLTHKLGQILSALATTPADDPSYPGLTVRFQSHVDLLMNAIAQGQVTADMTPLMRDALRRGDVSGLVSELHQMLLEGQKGPSHLARFRADQLLTAHLGPTVTQWQENHPPITAKPLLPAPDTPAPMGKTGQPELRLQMLGIDEKAMAPMLETMQDISHAAFTGDIDGADALLMKLMDELRPHVEGLSPSLQKAFAQGNASRFMADVKDAILGQTPTDDRHHVGLTIDHFLDRSMVDAFQRLVKDLPGAQGVKVAEVLVPAQANVGVRNFARLQEALEGLARACTPPRDEAAFQTADKALTQALETYLETVRHGQAGPSLGEGMKAALAQGDMGAVGLALYKQLHAALPQDLGGLRDLACMRLGPLLSEYFDRRGDLVLPSPSTVTLQPKTHFDAPLLPEARLGALNGSAQQMRRVEKALQGTAQAMLTGDTKVIEAQLRRVADGLRPMLKGLSESERLAWSLSDGEAFMTDLALTLLKQVPEDQREVLAAQVDLFMRPRLEACFERLVEHVLDKPLQADKGNPQNPPLKIEVQGRVYVRSDDHQLGSGNFGSVWAYHNPKDPADQLVMKVPDMNKATLHEVLNEGKTTVVAMGTGGGSGNNVQLSGVIRGPNGVNLVFRRVGGGSLQGKLDELHDVKGNTALMMGKVGLMADMASALRRLHGAKGMNHLDIALRNVLLDDRGRAVLADHGLAVLNPEGQGIEGAQGLNKAANVPVRWTAPETLANGTVTEKSEVFSLGVAFAELVFGLNGPPWPDLSNVQIALERKNGNWDAQAMVQKLGVVPTSAWPDAQVGQDLVALITRMLDVDPTQRPTLAEVLQHPLMQKVQESDRLALAKHLQPEPVVPVVAQPVAPVVNKPPVLTQIENNYFA